MLVAAVAQEPLLLVGQPGAAKSDLVLKFKDALGLPDADYFEYTLTRVTEPSEILGPIDASELRDGRLVRREQGKLPAARLAFLDEIFKSNSAILNILLTIVNERKVYHDGVPQPVRLWALFAAANDVPEHGEYAALKDRFVLKVESQSVQNEHFDELIAAGLQSEVDRALNQKPWAEGHATLTDVVKANRLLAHQFAGRDGDSSDRGTFFPEPVFREFQRLIKTLVREDRVFVSDRKLVKLYKLLRVRAWLMSGGAVGFDDLGLLAFVGETLEEIQLLREKVPLLLGRV
jgi:MoxR-like ATPase